MSDDTNKGHPQPHSQIPGEDAGPTPVSPTPPPSDPAVRAATAGATPDTLTRFVAFLIDAVAVAVIGLVPVIGGLVGMAYVLFRDGLDLEFMQRRSLGKKLMKLTVVRTDGQPMDLATSARRNWPLVFGSLTQLLLFVPVIGWILIPFVLIAGAVLVIIEIVRVITKPEGKRLGDDFAGTRVVTAVD